MHNLNFKFLYVQDIYNISQSFTLILKLTITVLIYIPEKGKYISLSLHLTWKTGETEGSSHEVHNTQVKFGCVL